MENKTQKPKLNIPDVMNGNFKITLSKEELIKLITESYAEGFGQGGKTAHDLIEKCEFDGDNVKLRNAFIKDKLLELKFGKNNLTGEEFIVK